MSLDRPKTLRWGSLLLILSLLLVFVVFWDQSAFLAWKQNAGAIPFFAALAILPATGIPTTPFFLLAGATFGLRTGLIGTALAVAVNLALCYLLAQSVLRQLITTALAKFDYEIPELETDKALRFIILVKLTPGVPTFLKNYITALAGVPFGLYMLVCWSITYAYAVSLIVMGESILERDINKGITGGIIFILVVVLLWYLRRRYQLHQHELNTPTNLKARQVKKAADTRSTYDKKESDKDNHPR